MSSDSDVPHMCEGSTQPYRDAVHVSDRSKTEMTKFVDVCTERQVNIGALKVHTLQRANVHGSCPISNHVFVKNGRFWPSFGGISCAMN